MKRSLFFMCACIGSSLYAADTVINLARTEDFAEIITNERVAALFVYPPGQPCKNLIAAAHRLAKEDTKTIFVIVDIRSFANLRTQYRVGGIPSILIFAHGTELARATGQRDVNGLRMLLAKTFLGTTKAFINNPLSYAAAWIKGHFTTNPVCDNQ